MDLAELGLEGAENGVLSEGLRVHHGCLLGVLHVFDGTTST